MRFPLVPASIAKAAALLGVALALLPPLQAQEATQRPGLEAKSAYAVSQQAIGRTIGDYTLTDREGRPVRIASFRGKPLLVSFIYTGCFEVCPTTTRALNDTVRALQGRFGINQFNVISVGFNQPADSPQAMKAFAAQHRISQPNWDFLSPPPAVVRPLTRDFGFVYQATPAGFDHVLQVSLVDGEGRIMRQVYGDRPAADALGEPMKQLLVGAPLPEATAIETIVDQIRLLCTVYDPKTGTYRVDYSLAIEAAGGLTFIIAVALYMFNEWRSRRRARRSRRPA
ncbi:MAG: electron transport protein SCO1/SenC [Ramlibacter sp.]|jgi:protein SCO1/2|nr:electron transport protein SCO1/SenC [Ramlibacter sp.]